MAKALNFELPNQSKIRQEGNVKGGKGPVSVGKRAVDFYLPQYAPELSQEVVQQNTSQAQHIVDKINQYIENMADDYFLLGLHLIALHKLLKQSRLSTDQVKAWYTENINMPYSSAMQCKKVAEVYAEHPELINRYTASGAYLLTSIPTTEEREALWQEAKGDKPSASVRDLREVLKRRRENQIQAEPEVLPPTVLTFRMPETEIHESFVGLIQQVEHLMECEDLEERTQLRKHLIQASRELIRRMEEMV